MEKTRNDRERNTSFFGPSPSETQILFLIATMMIVLALTGSGCASLSHEIVTCPLTYSEQEKEVLAIVPKGTRREEVLRRLNAAGIEGSFGTSRRIYYCEIWTRPNGERWHLNLALLFDEYGKLYRTQVGDSEVSAIRGDAASPKSTVSTDTPPTATAPIPGS